MLGLTKKQLLSLALVAFLGSLFVNFNLLYYGIPLIIIAFLIGKIQSSKSYFNGLKLGFLYGLLDVIFADFYIATLPSDSFLVGGKITLEDLLLGNIGSLIIFSILGLFIGSIISLFRKLEK